MHRICNAKKPHGNGALMLMIRGKIEEGKKPLNPHSHYKLYNNKSQTNFTIKKQLRKIGNFLLDGGKPFCYT